MERLTERVFGEWCVPYIRMQEAIDRLAAYEDTGLEPEQIEIMHGHATALNQEMCYYEELKADGRLVVLPCKVGDTVYVLNDDRIVAEVVLAIRIQDNEIYIEKTFVPDAEIADFGTTVFFTREEAETALAREAEP